MVHARTFHRFDPVAHAKLQQRHFTDYFRRARRWILPMSVLFFVIGVAFHLSEEERFLHLFLSARPSWILLGFCLQIGTYYTQALVWRTGLGASESRMKVNKLARLSLAQLFINQALPSASISGAFFMMKVLEQRGIPRKTVSYTLGLSVVSYVLAYVSAVLFVFLKVGVPSDAGIWILALLSCLGLVLLILWKNRPSIPSFLNRFQNTFLLKSVPLGPMRKLLEALDPRRLSGFMLFRATLLQILIFLLDFLSLWSMARALGVNPNLGPIFTAYTIACVARTVSFLPGGIGIFEAAAIASLHSAGMAISTAVAATLLYRGLSFWLPMIPGVFLVRKEFSHEKAKASYGVEHFWEMSKESAFQRLRSTLDGLSSDVAKERLLLQGKNVIHGHSKLAFWKMLWRQLNTPLVLILVFASCISFFVGELADALVIMVILAVSMGIGTYREREAQNAIFALKSQLSPRSSVIRDGKVFLIPTSDLVQGDVVMLAAGGIVPADLLILESKDCYVNEAAITGESLPVLKEEVREGIPLPTPVGERKNVMFLGSHVETGMAKCLVVNTGPATMFGSLAEVLKEAPPKTNFELSISAFGYMMIKIMLLIVTVVFISNALRSGRLIESLMFSVALAVGLSPELLPLIISYDLSIGAKKLAARGLLVRHPQALENIAAMDILCTDKTGTLTEGVVRLIGAFDADGNSSEHVKTFAYLNASLQAGIPNPLDDVLKGNQALNAQKYEKVGEIPFDFHRKRLSVVVRGEEGKIVITKGAFQKVTEVCRFDDTGRLEAIVRRFETWSNSGNRVLGLAVRNISEGLEVSPGLEKEMSFLGFIVFADTLKQNVAETIKDLQRLGISTKIISGDNTLVTKAISKAVGLEEERVLDGKQIDLLSEAALQKKLDETQLYTQVDPRQKERIINSLRRKGHTVGYMGDGINDVSAMHVSDVSISVEKAVDVAKNAADLVLLTKSLDLVKEGIEAGRTTFHNSMKYINITMSANFGNMLSMAIASVFLPYLPLLAGQILLNNLLSDIPSLGIASDNVDKEQLLKPTMWNLKGIFRYMVVFGLLSSFFDFITFYILLNVLGASTAEFRTAWFTESLLTELLVVLILRTGKSVFKSRPSRLLAFSTSGLVLLTLVLSHIPGTANLGFVGLKFNMLVLIVLISICYLAFTEIIKLKLAPKSISDEPRDSLYT